MSIQIVYGRAGSGKTKCCFDIVEKHLGSGDENILYIVPEQLSLQTESKIIKRFSQNKIDVLSFERLSQRIFSKVGPICSNYLDSSGKLMLMHRALISVQKKLVFFSDAAETEGFCNVLVNMADEFKRHNISDDMLMGAVDSVSGPLKLKIADLAVIYKEYNKLIVYPNADNEDSLSAALEKIIKHDLYKNVHVIFDEFTNFSALQLSVVREFMLRAKSVTVSLCTDSLMPPQTIADIFFHSKKTANRLFDMAQADNIRVLPNIYTGECKKYPENKELEFLEQNYFKYPAKIYNTPTENILLFKANNYYGETEAAAINILRLCREENYRFRDFAVITRAMDIYVPLIRNVFEEYEILYHIDEKQNAMAHPFTRSVLSLFDAVIHNFSYEALFTWFKSDYCDVNKEDLFVLENYVLACGSTPALWRKPDDWTFLPRGYTAEVLEKINDTKKRILPPIINFTDKFKGRKTVREISEAFYEFICESGAERKVFEKINHYRQNGQIQKSNLLSSVWNALMSTLDSLVSVLGDNYITFEKYYAILKSGLGGCETGEIPPTVDEVSVCSVDRFKSRDKKCVIILGTSNGVFPKSHTDEGILSDNDRDALASAGLEMADSSILRQAGENYIVYSAITAPTQKLFIFYPAADNEGAALYPSLIVDRIKTIFPNVRQQDNIYDNPDILPLTEGNLPSFNKMLTNREKYKEIMLWFAENQPERLKRALKALKYSNLPGRLSPGSVSALFGKTLRGSISRAELYNKCQFAYFLKYGLGAMPRQKHTIRPDDAGIFMHEIIESYSRYASKIGWNNISAQECRKKTEEITDNVLNKYLSETYTSSTRFNYLSKKLKNIMSTVAQNISEFYRKSSFVPLGYEITFDENGVFPPIEVEVNGTKVLLRGKVDRADVWRTEKGNYISIVDYKSSSKNIDYSEILCGIQIQLPIYIKAVCEALSKKDSVKTMPAAMLYYKFDAPVISAGRNISDEEIWAEVMKKLRMHGVTLEAEKIDEGIGTLFSVKSAATSEQIDKICNTAYRQLKKAFKGISEGYININPLRVAGRTACDNCPYDSICRFDTSFAGNKYRSFKKISKEEFFCHVDSMDK